MNIKIIPIHIKLDTIYLLRGEGAVLVDGGDPFGMARLKQGMNRVAIKPEDIRLIILTHGHWDHIGSAREIKEWTGARLMMHRDDLYMMNQAPPPQPPGFTAWGKISIEALKLATREMRIEPFEVDIVAGDEDIPLGEYGIAGRVVHTPGHSWGSVSVVLDSGEAFVGDLATRMFPMRLSPGLPIFGDNMQTIRQSWRKLMDMGVRMVYPAHGKPFAAELVYRSL
jgi:hydroxyacylglutathione hydrolase